MCDRDLGLLGLDEVPIDAQACGSCDGLSYRVVLSVGGGCRPGGLNGGAGAVEA